jgi:hypothetical protein
MYPNPFAQLLDRLKIGADAQGKYSYFRALLVLGSTIHANNPTPWNSTSANYADECLLRLHNLGLEGTPALAEFRAFLAENVK